MKSSKKSKLEAAGWKVGSASEFLDLSTEEASIVRLKIKLARAVRERRAQLAWTQQDLANKIESSQSRVAKIEAADASVSSDLAIRALYALGINDAGLARIVGKALPQLQEAAHKSG